MPSASSTVVLLALAYASLAPLAPAAAQAPAAPSSAAPTADSAAPASPSPTDAPPAPASERTAEETFDLRVKALEEKVVDLKEKVYRTKARLLLLQETVLGGELSTGARAVLVHRNEMGSLFVLESVAYALDGAPIFTRVDSNGDLSSLQEAEVFKGRIIPGQHQLAVRLVYRGNGMGMFSYLDGYRFKVQSSYTFNAEPGRTTTVRIVGYERGGMTTDLQDRPAVRYDVDTSREPRKLSTQVPTSPALEPSASTGPQ